MPYTYTIESEQRLIRVRMWGSVTPAEIEAVRQSVAADPRFKTDLSELVDLRELTLSTAITTTDIERIASSNIDRVARRAFVAPDPATYGLIRMYDTLRTLDHAEEQNGIFRNMEDAEAWLGLAPSTSIVGGSQCS